VVAVVVPETDVEVVTVLRSLPIDVENVSLVAMVVQHHLCF